MISLDNLASRYGILPSEALTRGSTLDFRVMEVAVKWEQRQRRLADPIEAQKVKAEDLNKKHSQEELQAMIDKVKEK